MLIIRGEISMKKVVGIILAIAAVMAVALVWLNWDRVTYCANGKSGY